MPSRLLLPFLFLLVGLVVGCSDDGSDADDRTSGGPVGLAERFSAAADRAGTAGVDQSGELTTCFVLDDEGVDRLSAALGLEPSDRLDDSARLSGSEGNEMLQCSYTVTIQDEAPIGIVIARTDEDLDDYVDRVGAFDDPPVQLDRDSEGLDPATVTGFARDGFQQAVWVDDGVRVQLGAREQEVDADSLFEALPVLVNEIERALGAA